MMISSPGIYGIPEAEYHADPVVEPSLSNSIAATLLSRSPMHARIRHPRLCDDRKEQESGRLDIGSAYHAIVLGGEDKLHIVDAADWRTKTAQQERDQARAAGMIPVLSEMGGRMLLMRDALFDQLSDHEASEAFGPTGQCEQTVIWQERSGIWCRCRPDWMTSNVLAPVYDLKTTTNADPDFWSRQIYGQQYEIQAAFYTRGIAAVRRCKPPPFRFVAQEIEPPYAVTVHQLDPAALAFAEHKVEHAIRVWGECLRTDRWPGYPPRVCHHEAPPWLTARWDEREEREKVDQELLERTRLIQRPMDAA